MANNNVVNLNFGNTGEQEDGVPDFPVDEEDIKRDKERIARVYFERMVDEIIDTTVEQMMGADMLRRNLRDEDHHKECTKYFFLMREAIISFLTSANGMEASLKQLVDEKVKTAVVDVGMDVPTYSYSIYGMDGYEDFEKNMSGENEE